MLDFIYELYDPRTDIVGYVGITDNPNERYKQHLRMVDGNAGKNSWISAMLADGIQPGMRIREVIENDHERALQQERYWIRFYLDRGVLLTNIQFGDKSVPVEDEVEPYSQDVPPLTEQQILVWRIGYGDANCTGLDLQKAKVTINQLYRLFSENDLLDNVCGASLDEKITYLRAMLLNTPRVHFVRQTRQFLYKPEKPVSVFCLCDLVETVLPRG